MKTYINIHGNFRARIICDVQGPRYQPVSVDLVVTKLISRMGAFLVKLSSGEWHRITLMISRHWWEYTLHKSYFVSSKIMKKKSVRSSGAKQWFKESFLSYWKVLTYSTMIKTVIEGLLSYWGSAYVLIHGKNCDWRTPFILGKCLHTHPW